MGAPGDAYEYREYEDAEWARRFRTFLHGRAWTHAEGPVALFNQAVGWLRRHRVLLPGVSVLARQVPEARKGAEKRLHATVAGAARRADPALPGEPVATLRTPEGSRFPELERPRRPPTRTTGTAFARALERVVTCLPRRSHADQPRAGRPPIALSVAPLT
ncbi:DUF4158 domain-containing protein [Streptomyces sp. MA15]|nr:DUF4158 domain-containing protein [Streptomyces sp. MA15]MDN3271385.1 DUF4158 domain-containing protein [Streptomyces sp. MA15]